MGSGIAQVSAQSGFVTTVVDIDAKVMEKGMARIAVFLEKAKRRGHLSEEALAAAKENLNSSSSLDALKDCDIVIEAVTENVELKEKIFKQLGELTRPDAILATNTSSISITRIAAATNRPDKVLGMHFFNPVPMMKLVELIKGVTTSDETMSACREFSLALGKEPVMCKDTPAFVVNKLLIPYLLDAIRMLEDGVASAEDIDKAMMHGCGYPMGPITLLDYVGLDTTLHVADVMFDELREQKYAAPVILRRMVEVGHYGKKSGRGFYSYE